MIEPSLWDHEGEPEDIAQLLVPDLAELPAVDVPQSFQADWRTMDLTSRLPHWDQKEQQVYDYVGGKKLGRLREYKGKICIYCRAHGCEPAPVDPKRSPSHELTMRWFQIGFTEVPLGKAGKAQHLKMWRDLVQSCNTPA